MIMRTIKTTILMVLALLGVPTYTMAQDAEEREVFSVTPSVDVVNKYIFRGAYQGGGASIQPSLSLEWGCGISLSAWGSTSIADFGNKEIDLSISYNIGGFTAYLYDMWWEGEGAKYGHYKDDHYFDLELEYCFGEKVPLTILWSTFLFGGEAAELDEDGKRMYTSYLNLSYDFDVKGVALTPSIGINPWKSQMHDEFGVLEIGLKASKEIELTDKFSLPLFTQLIISPAYDDVHFVVGLTF